MDSPSGHAGNSDQLNGWKDIAAYLGKSVRTVQRWERQAGLPVHRVQPLGEVVFAFRSELDLWRSTPIVEERDAHHPQADTDELQAVVAYAESNNNEPTSSSVEVAVQVPSSKSRQIRGQRWVLVVGVALILAAVGFSLVRKPEHPSMAVGVAPAEPQIQGQHFRILVQGAKPLATLQRWTRVPNGQSELMSTPIQANDAGEIVWGFSTDCRTETGTHHLWVEDLETGDRSTSITLVVLSNPACHEALPDLSSRVDRVDRTFVKPGDAVTVSFTIWNMGTAAAVPTQTRIRLGRQSTRTGIGDPALVDVPTPGLDVGDSASRAANVPIPKGTAAGVYYLWIVADNGSATIEPNSFNNFARSQAIVVSASGPDK